MCYKSRGIFKEISGRKSKRLPTKSDFFLYFALEDDRVLVTVNYFRIKNKGDKELDD